ncbi:MAG: hypothetical protein ACFFD4_12965 [Candidatus Odinarchaeota archaeon]
MNREKRKLIIKIVLFLLFFSVTILLTIRGLYLTGPAWQSFTRAIIPGIFAIILYKVLVYLVIPAIIHISSSEERKKTWIMVRQGYRNTFFVDAAILAGIVISIVIVQVIN